MKRFENYDELLESLGFDNNYKNYVMEELEIFLETVGSDIVKSKLKHPRKMFTLEINSIQLKLGVTSIKLKDDSLTNYYWIINYDEFINHMNNIAIMDKLFNAIDLISEKASSSDIVKNATIELNRIVNNSDFSYESVKKCVEEIKSSAKYAGYPTIQYELINEVNNILA